jgi:hypothetical protein
MSTDMTVNSCLLSLLLAKTSGLENCYSLFIQVIYTGFCPFPAEWTCSKLQQIPTKGENIFQQCYNPVKQWFYLPANTEQHSKRLASSDLMVQSCVHKNLPSNSVLSPINPIYIFMSYSYNICINMTLPSKPTLFPSYFQ